MTPAFDVPEAERPPAVALTISGFIRGRAAMELVNMTMGIWCGLFLLLPADSLDPSPAFHSLTQWAPEWLYGLVLIAWGIGTAVAWFCPAWLRCRSYGMLGSVGFWAGLAIVTARSSGWTSPIALICVSQAVGCWWTFKRIYSFSRAVNVSGG